MQFIDFEIINKALERAVDEKDINAVLDKYKNANLIDNIAVNYADDLIVSGNYDRGMMIMNCIYNFKGFKYLSDEITIYMRLAQYHIEKGETEKGKEFLIKIANETSSNYEESLGFRNLLDVWNEYKHLVAGEVKISVNSETENDELSDEELLRELLEEVHSGGYDAYLTYHGSNFNKVLRLARKAKMTLLTEQLERIKEKFPNGKIPRSEAKIECIIEKNGLNFDKEDELFCSTVCKEFPDCI